MKNMTLIGILLFIVSCSHEPQIINYSKDVCDFCKMTIMEERFAAQSISKKGKVFKFDDAHCLINFLKNGGIWSNEVEGVYFSDYLNKNSWIKSENAFLLKSDALRSPMGGNIAAFKSMEDRESIRIKLNGELLTWENIKPGK